MTIARRKATLIGLVLIAGLMAGCTRATKPVQFYRLTAETGISTATPLPTTAKSPLIGLGMIRLPDYLNRPQIVVAIADNQYQLSEEHRWAERLDQNIALALYKALPSQLGTDRLVRYPWAQRLSVDYQVDIDILEFNVDAQGQSRLTAQWTIKRPGQASIDKRSTYQAPASTTDYPVMVKAQSLCLSQLGAEIAHSLRQLLVADKR